MKFKWIKKAGIDCCYHNRFSSRNRDGMRGGVVKVLNHIVNIVFARLKHDCHLGIPVDFALVLPCRFVCQLISGHKTNKRS